MNDFVAALIGAAVGGGFSFWATWWAARRSADDALTDWQRDKKAEVLSEFVMRSRSLLKPPRKEPEQPKKPAWSLLKRPPARSVWSGSSMMASREDFWAVNLGEALALVRLWAPDFQNQAAKVYEAWWSAVKQNEGTNLGDVLDLIKAMEADVRAEFKVGTLEPVNLR